MAARLHHRVPNFHRVYIGLKFMRPDAMAKVIQRVAQATTPCIALLLYESPFNNIVSCRAMPCLFESPVIKNIAEILEHARAST